MKYNSNIIRRHLITMLYRNITFLQSEPDQCQPTNPCKNGGQCEDQFQAYKCVCAPNWDGPTCEICKLIHWSFVKKKDLT